jgi:hypothetical protein
MKPHYFLLGLIFIVGWNVFLIQRDQKLFDAYYGAPINKTASSSSAN